MAEDRFGNGRNSCFIVDEAMLDVQRRILGIRCRSQSNVEERKGNLWRSSELCSIVRKASLGFGHSFTSTSFSTKFGEL